MTWIFAYGSLVSPTSLEATIGRRVTPGDGMHVAELTGYGRRWNYGSKVLRGNWTNGDGRVTGGLVVSLGVAAAAGESINGVVFAVDPTELADLDWRERDYERVDVTDRITLLDDSAGLEIGGPIAVYVPRRSSIERYESARDADTAGVRRSYRDLVDAAFADLGEHHLAWYRRTPEPDVPVVDIEIDPLPARRPTHSPARRTG